MAQTPPTPRHGERRLDVRPSGLPPVPRDLTAKVVGDFRGSSSGSGQLGGEEAGSLGRGWSRRCLWVRGEGMRGEAGSPCSATAPPPAPAPPLPAAEMGPCAHVPFPTKGSQSSGLGTQGGSGQLCMNVAGGRERPGEEEAGGRNAGKPPDLVSLGTWLGQLPDCEASKREAPFWVRLPRPQGSVLTGASEPLQAKAGDS